MITVIEIGSDVIEPDICSKGDRMQAHEVGDWIIGAPVLARDPAAEDEEHANDESGKDAAVLMHYLH